MPDASDCPKNPNPEPYLIFSQIQEIQVMGPKLKFKQLISRLQAINLFKVLSSDTVIQTLYRRISSEKREKKRSNGRSSQLLSCMLPNT